MAHNFSVSMSLSARQTMNLFLVFWQPNKAMENSVVGRFRSILTSFIEHLVLVLQIYFDLS